MNPSLSTNAPLPLSVAIITLDEEDNLPRCLESVRDVASEIIVIDSGSRDKTAEIVRRAGGIFEFHPWAEHVAQKNIALRRCSQAWVLALDADEALSPELAGSIRQLFAGGEPSRAGYWVNRRTYYLGRWIWHVWYPEWRLRLVRNGRAQWDGLDPHDNLRVDGPTDRLHGDLLHYSFDDFHDHLQRTIKYARIAADSYARAGRKCRWYHLVISPWAAFFKHLLLKQAWRDGWRGWIICVVSLFGTFAKYAFMLEAERAQRDSDIKA